MMMIFFWRTKGAAEFEPNKKSLLTTTVNEFQNYHGDGKWVYKITKAVLVKDLVVTLFLIKQFYLLI